jgi:hypothetical protein
MQVLTLQKTSLNRYELLFSAKQQSGLTWCASKQANVPEAATFPWCGGDAPRDAENSRLVGLKWV